jgi:4-amino-4-deoxy-L-arabinose transferase-like glycosyltransferase
LTATGPTATADRRSAAVGSEIQLWRAALLLVGALTLLRLVFLLVSPLDLDVEEAQYWSWAQTPDWGYFSKPPLIAWLIGAVTSLCGNGTACVRAASPLLHGLTALVVGATGTALGGRRVGAWAAMLYATMPGVSFSAMLMTTDVPLLLFWSIALLALVRLRQGGGLGWALIAGVACGLGALSKYAMLFFLAGVALYLILSPQGRRAIGWRAAAVMTSLVLLILLPNVLWNAARTWITVAQTASTAGTAGRSFQLSAILEYVVGQIAIFGPAPLYLMLRQGIAWRRARAEAAAPGTPLGWDDRLLLLCLSLPFFVPFLVMSMVSRANANWTAFAFIAGCVLVAGVADKGRAAWYRRAAVISHACLGPLIYGLVWLTPHWPVVPGLPHALERMTGWQPLGGAVASEMAKDGPIRLLTNDRSLTARLLYYAHVAPGNYAVWNPDGFPNSHYELVASLKPGDRGPFLLVANSPLADEIPQHFEQASPAGMIDVPLFTGAKRRFFLYRLSGFRGYGP